MRVLKLFGATLAPAIPATKVNSAANQAVPADPAPNRQAQWSRWGAPPAEQSIATVPPVEYGDVDIIATGIYCRTA
jgi:hypothetical protein